MSQMQTYRLKATAIIKFLTQKSEQLEDWIICKPEKMKLITTDNDLYEALGTLKETEYKHHRLVKFLEVVDVFSSKAMNEEKKILTFERIEKIQNEIMEAEK